MSQPHGWMLYTLVCCGLAIGIYWLVTWVF